MGHRMNVQNTPSASIDGSVTIASCGLSDWQINRPLKAARVASVVSLARYFQHLHARSRGLPHNREPKVVSGPFGKILILMPQG